MKINERQVLYQARQELKKLLEERNVDTSHDIRHSDCVLNNINRAIQESQFQISEQRMLSMRLAALLHDANDRKYFKNEQNDLKILQLVFKDQLNEPIVQQIILETLEMISYVSAAQNGNNVPERALLHPELLWVRQSDRLEALGRVGIARCYLYNLNKTNRPLVTDKTPRAETEADVWKYASKERLKDYQKSGASDSMLSHYYDKLLRIALLDPQVTQNKWLVEEGLVRVQPMIDLCIYYGKTGEINQQMLDDCTQEWLQFIPIDSTQLQ